VIGNERASCARLARPRIQFNRRKQAEIADIDDVRAFAKIMTLTLHPRSDYGSARASRIAALDRLLTWLRGLPGVALMRCDEIASAVEDLRS
jgi:hypothetical protein